MKSFKIFSVLAFALALFATASFAQVRTTTRTTVNQGTFLDYPGALTTATPTSAASDTLQISDTVAYILPINHLNNVDFFHTWYWTKSGAGTATITLSFLQGNDPYNFTPVLKGVNQTAYTKTYTLSASGWNFVSFATDTANFTGRYLKVQYMTSNTAAVGGKVFSRTKSTIK